MSNIENISDNNFKKIAGLKGVKKSDPLKAQGDKPPILSGEREDVATISVTKADKALPKNELQKMEAWKEQLKEMPDSRADKVEQAKQRYQSGFYNSNSSEVMDKLLSGLEGDILS